MLRQAVMPQRRAACSTDAGDNAGAERSCWTAELPHAIAPYYFMVDLANFAEERHDRTHPAAIAWMRTGGGNRARPGDAHPVGNLLFERSHRA